MTIQYDNLNSTISAVGSDSNISVNIQPKGTGGLNVLGSGQNLLFRSQLIGGTDWQSVGGATASTNAVVAPDSTTTASTLTVASGGYYRQITISSNRILSGVTYTYSCYVKASASGGAANVRLTTNNVSAWNTGFSTRFALTSSWQRVSVTGTITGVDAYFIIGAIDATGTADATCAGNVDVWGAQFELGSVVNTYIPTTSAAIYGTPALTFSGVAGIGLESNGSMYHQPAGTGALQAQATTSTAAGGNVRGANAVDWQTSRGNASEVATGAFSGILSGRNNTASAFNSTVLGGGFNLAQGNNNIICAGQANTANGNFLQTASAIVSGQSNTANGFYNFIGAGFTNAGTSNAAVTTQSGTMNATTAVTLSGSNASIRVGQYITGTSIAADTYVAAISGTALTLSKVASGSSTSTLSFFTPHGVVVGGGWNVSSGSHSFVGGGGWAGATNAGSSTNRATGDWSSIVGGIGNLASGSNAFIGGGGFPLGNGNTASGQSSVVTGGYANSVSGFASTCIGGTSNIANGNYGVVGGANNNNNAANGVIIGGQWGTARNIAGNFVMPACASPIAGASGVSQAALVILGRQTTDATATALCSDANAAGSTNQVILPNNSAYFFTGEIISGVTGGGNTKGFTIEGVIKRGANAAATTLVGSTVMSTFGDAGAATWTIALTADTTNGGLRVTFTGQLATTIRTVAQIRTTEMTF
jgi:hypothetical protein